MIFYTHNKKPVEIADYIKNYFSEKSGKLYKDVYSLWVGCDSSYRNKGLSEYVTVVGIRIRGAGVHVLHKRSNIVGKIKPLMPHTKKLIESIDKKNHIFRMVLERLWQEVLEVEKVIVHLKEEGIIFYKKPEDSLMSAFTQSIGEIIVHVDFNGYEEHLSNHLTTAAISYFAVLGVHAETKPDAYAATYAANSYL